MSRLTAFLDFLDKRAIFHRLVLGVTLWMTWESFQWAARFAETTAKTGLDIAAMIAAVTAPIAALQGYVLKTYSEYRAP